MNTYQNTQQSAVTAVLTYECHLDNKVMINYRKHTPELEKHHDKSQVH